MKRIILIIFIFSSQQIVFPQSDTSNILKRKYKFGINTSINYSNHLRGLTAGATCSKGVHFLLCGITIWEPNIDVREQSVLDNSPSSSSFYTNQKKFGIDLTYKIFPNPENKRFKLFFFYDLDMAKIVTNENIHEWVYGINNYVGGNEEETLYVMTHIWGYGFKMKIFKGLYFNNSLGFGIGFIRKDFIDIYPDPYSYFNQSEQGGGFGSGIATLFNIGLGYELK